MLCIFCSHKRDYLKFGIQGKHAKTISSNFFFKTHSFHKPLTMPSALNRKVTFNTIVRRMTTLNIYDYTTSEINDCWYNKDEMERITGRAVEVLIKVETANETHRYCIRGLEGHSRLGFIRKQKNRLDARQAVFKEQDRQWYELEECGPGDEAIADAYRQITSSCQKWAQIIGHQDQKTAEVYLLKEDDEGNEKSWVTKTKKLLKPICYTKKTKEIKNPRGARICRGYSKSSTPISFSTPTRTGPPAA